MFKFLKILVFIVFLCFMPIIFTRAEDKDTEEYYYDEYDYYDQQQQISDGELIVDVACQYIGNPYVYGGNSLTEGCDCSHFVWLVLKEAIDYKGQYVTSWGFETLGQSVQSLEEAAAGDIICYGEHVAIYDGKGMIVQAKNSECGITHDRMVDCSPIVTIRRFTN